MENDQYIPRLYRKAWNFFSMQSKELDEEYSFAIIHIKFKATLRDLLLLSLRMFQSNFYFDRFALLTMKFQSNFFEVLSKRKGNGFLQFWAVNGSPLVLLKPF